jgi:hypothetical protein
MMRNFWILGILVLGFSGLSFGGETSAAGHASQQVEATSAWNGILHSDGSGTPWSAGDGDQERNPVCYQIRSYLVRRAGRDSDEVEAVGYRTCLPGARVEMRSTEAPTQR